MMDIDPIADLAGVFADAVMQAGTADLHGLFLIENAKDGILTEIELSAEQADEAFHPLRLFGLLTRPGHPGPKVFEAAGDGGMHLHGVGGFITPDQQAFGFYFICFGEVHVLTGFRGRGPVGLWGAVSCGWGWGWDGAQHTFYDAVHRGVLYPPDDGDEVVFGIDINKIHSVTDMYKRFGRRAGEEFVIGVEKKVHISIGRFHGCGGQGLFYPLFRDQMIPVPLPAMQGQQSEASHVVGVDEHTAAPMAAAADALHGLAVEYDPGIAIAIPAPGIGGTDGVHNILFDDLRQGSSPYAGGGEGEGVDANVIVFIYCAGGIAGAGGPGVGFAGGSICPVRLSPECAFPITRLSQHHIPGEEAVVGTRKREEHFGFADVPGIAGCRGGGVIDLDGGDVCGDGILYAVDESPVDGQSYDGGEKAFGDAVGHVHSCGFAPFCNDIAFIDDEAGLVAPVLHRSHGVVIGFVLPEAFCLEEDLVAGCFGLTPAGESDGIREFTAVEA